MSQEEFSDRIRKLSPAKLVLLAEQLQSRLTAAEQAQREPIAIVGIGCRFPGGVDSPETFWDLLCKGADVIREVPADRWDVDAIYDSNPDTPGKISSRWGGFLDQVDQFDAGFFGISPREAISLDPQQRLLLEVAWEAIESAGIPADQLAGSQTGVFVGMSGSDYCQIHLTGGLDCIDTYLASGTAHSSASGRLAYFFGTHGPTLTLDTACSSSLVAVHTAVLSLRASECRMALAGGVNLILAPVATIALSKAHLMAPDGRCKAFDDSANGFVRSEGAAMVVLKRLTDAIADGDPIMAVIRGSAVNQDGRSNGLTAPNGPAQEALIRAALANAGISALEVGYVETHGTGTSLGDPIEVQALAAAFQRDLRESPALPIGSVKTNIGHLEAAAGVAGLVKAMLVLQHGQVPPHLHLRKPNASIPWDRLRITVPAELTAWGEAGKRIAAVSSFGFSGTNAHLLLGEAPELEVPHPGVDRPLHILPLSAVNEPALRAVAKAVAGDIGRHPGEFANICHTAGTGRSHFGHRLAVVAPSAEEATKELERYAHGQNSPRVTAGHIESHRRPGIVFLFTGQGSQYPEMGKALFESQPVFREALEHVTTLLQPYLDRPLLPILFGTAGDPSLLSQTGYCQPALFALQYALVTLWRTWGITPAAVMGHSVGEYAAACAAGILRLEDGARLIAARGRLMQSLPEGGAMAAVMAAPGRVEAALSGQVSIAAYNGREHVVISGHRHEVSQVLKKLEAQGISSRWLEVSHAFHSPLIDPVLHELERLGAEARYSRPTVPFVSNLTGQFVEGDEVAASGYWREHARQPVQFARGMQALHGNRYDIFLEIGPHPVLNSLASRSVDHDRNAWLPSLYRGRGDWEQMLESLSKLYTRGIAVDWAGFDRGYSRRRIHLATYPFQRQRYWLEAAKAPESRKEDPATIPFLGARWLPRTPARKPEAPSRRTWILFGGHDQTSVELQRTLTLRGDTVVCVQAGDSFVAHADGSFTIDPAAPEHYGRLFDAVTIDGLSEILHLWSTCSILPAELTPGALEESQRLASASVLFLIQSLLSRVTDTVPLRLITRGAQAVVDGDGARIALSQAPLWGFSHALSVKHPEVRCTLIDLDPESPPARDAAQIIETAEPGEKDENQIAWRGPTRFIRRLVRSELTGHGAAVRFHPDASYLIFGGLRGLGTIVARWMVEHGARSLVLAGRRGLTEESRPIIEELEQRGSRVTAMAVDIADPKAVQAMLAQIRETLPPLRGVVQGAGVLDGRPLPDQTWESMSTVLSPKIAGSWNLYHALEDTPLDFLVLFSSVSSLIGSAGQLGYAAGNAFLDALGCWLRTRGVPAVSINWGAWADVGMAADRAMSGDAFGEQRLSVAQGLTALERILGSLDAGAFHSPVQVAVVAPDLFLFLERLAEAAGSPFFHELKAGRSQEIQETGTATEVDWRDAVDAAAPAERATIILHALHQIAERVLRIPPGELRGQEPLRNLGMDSLMALEIRQQMGNALRTILPMPIFLEGPSVQDAATAVAGWMSESTGQEGTAPLVPNVSVDELSDERVTEMLAQLLSIGTGEA